MFRAICFVAVAVLATAALAYPGQYNIKKGYSFMPDKSMNLYVHPSKAEDSALRLGSPKSAVQRLSDVSRQVGLSFCGTCVDFADNALEYLLNAVLNLGIVGSCQAISAYIEQKFGQIAGVICDLLCDYVGIDEFVKIIEKADLDPIYYCELLKACPINDHGDANITLLSVMPNKGPQGNFEIQMKYTSVNGTGTGEIYIGIKTVDGVPLEDSFLAEAQQPGTYVERINLTAKPDPDCDPSQGPCESWQAGTYYVTMAICNGECGSKHPHSQIYSTATANFTITG